MAILKIAQMGHPVLRVIAQPVPPELIPSPEFQVLLSDMLETMEDYDGAGLAAPQVHHSLRIVCLELSSERGPEFMINPVIEILTEETESMMEGCLSIQGIRGRVWRPNHLRITFLDHTGEECGYELEGFPAIVTQHECDHLDGVLFIDKCDPKTLAFLPEYRRYGALDELGEHEDEDEDADEHDLELDLQHSDEIPLLGTEAAEG